MAKTKTDNRQHDTTKDQVDHESRSQSGIKRRRPIKWDLRQENLFLAVALEMSVVKPDFRAVAEELGTSIVSADTLRKKLPEIYKRARAVLDERRQASEGFIPSDLEKDSEEESEEESDMCSEPSSPGTATPQSSQRTHQVSDKPESYIPSRYAAVSDEKLEKRKYGNKNRQQGSRQDHRRASAARYDTPRGTSPNNSTGSPGLKSISAVAVPQIEAVQANRPEGNHGHNHNVQNKDVEKPQTRDDNGRTQTMGGTQEKNIRYRFNMDVSASA
ncbi:hypothetical protein DTO271G3_6091 [Paecilomyces variotii]|nr:hypothetical protein DTO271G3_6091 [Paecilomyces variotii]